MAEQLPDVKDLALKSIMEYSNFYLNLLLDIPKTDKYKDMREELGKIYNRGYNSILTSYDLKAVSHAYISACYDLYSYYKDQTCLNIEDDINDIAYDKYEYKDKDILNNIDDEMAKFTMNFFNSDKSKYYYNEENLKNKVGR